MTKIIKERNKSPWTALECAVCRYAWLPRKHPEDIKSCPRCHSFHWRGKKETHVQIPHN